MPINKTKIYSLDEAVDLIKKNPAAKFDESVEIHLRLGIDSRKGDQQVRGSLVLPHGTGKTKKIAAFVSENKRKEAKEAGADLIGGKDLIEQIQKDKKCDFDIAVAEPQIMKDLTRIARILGPKGLMPSLKNGTIGEDIKGMIEELKKGRVSFKNDDSGNLHQIVGKLSWEKDKLIENIKAFIEAVRKARPSGAKGIFIKNITLCSTMGQGIKVRI